MVVILLSRKDRDKTWIDLGCDEAEQGWGCPPILETSTGHEHGEQQSQRIDQQMALAPLHFLAAIIAALRASHLGGLDRLTVDARGTRGGFAPRCHAGPLAQGRDYLVPGPVVAPLGKGVIRSALGQQIVRQHIPLTAAAIQVPQGIEDFTHLHLLWAPSSWTRLKKKS